MDLIPILSTIILVATIVTMILAVGSYIVYKARERRKPRKVWGSWSEDKEVVQKEFFRRFTLEGMEGTVQETAGGEEPVDEEDEEEDA